MAGNDPPFIRGKSLMVGLRPRSGSDSESDHDTPSAPSFRSPERNVHFEASASDTNGNPEPPTRESTLSKEISQYFMEQSKIAARRGRSRSDEESLAQSLADAGLNAFGCVFVEMWAISEDGTKLYRPSGGHWMKPAFAQSLATDDLIEKAWSLDREAGDCPPGAGLAGTLAEESNLGSGRVHWRQIKSLMNDPFVQKGAGRRMERLHELGVGIVASVPFSFQDGKGIVLYFSRSTAAADTLRSPTNVRYLIGSTDLVGANYAVRKVREESNSLRKELLHEATKKVRKHFLKKEKMSLSSMIMNQVEMEKLKRASAQDHNNGLGTTAPSGARCTVTLAKKTQKLGRFLLKRINNSRKKWRGAKMPAAPRQSWGDCGFCFIGTFLTMLAILKVAKTIRVDSKFDFNAGWYSSSLCILFALTPAPVGQPRQLILGHMWNMLVGVACREIPTGGFGDFMERSDASDPDGMPLIWVQALAVALGVSGQALMGILHPPATGLSLAFMNSQWTWTTMASIMAVDGMVIVISMIILNLSEKKQYPLYWLGFNWQHGSGAKAKAGYVARSVKRSSTNTVNNMVDTVRIKEGGGENAV